MIFDYILQFLIIVGKYSSILLFMTTIVIFYRLHHYHQQNQLLYIYIFSFFINYIFNIICKIILKQPRPNEDLDLYHITIKKAPWYQFGTPSTNTQSIIFTTSFVTFTLRNIWISIPFIILSINTIIQQIFLSETYYLYQVISGAIIGFIIAYISYLFSCYFIQGDLIEKPDDDAPDIIGLL